MKGQKPHRMHWDRTTRLMDRLAGNIGWKLSLTNGFLRTFNGRHIISRDIPIKNGVSLGSGEREAIVVDATSPALVEAYARLRARIRSLGANPPDEDILGAVMVEVRETFRIGKRGELDDAHRRSGVNEIVENLPPDTEVSLSRFVRERVGVCRHASLLAAWFLERLVEDGFLRGTVSADRNHGGEEGHAWARFTRKRDGRVFVVDPALGNRGELHEVSRRTDWDYRRPEDIPTVQVPIIVFEWLDVDWLDAAVFISVIAALIRHAYV